MAVVTTHQCKNINDRPVCLVGVLLLSYLLPLESSGLEIWRQRKSQVSTILDHCCTETVIEVWCAPTSRPNIFGANVNACTKNIYGVANASASRNQEVCKPQAQDSTIVRSAFTTFLIPESRSSDLSIRSIALIQENWIEFSGWNMASGWRKCLRTLKSSASMSCLSSVSGPHIGVFARLKCERRRFPGSLAGTDNFELRRL